MSTMQRLLSESSDHVAQATELDLGLSVRLWVHQASALLKDLENRLTRLEREAELQSKLDGIWKGSAT